MEGKIKAVLCGVAGEYYVAAELSRRGYIASITLRNSPGIDILVTNQKNTKSVGIQVKTNQGKSKSWILNKKAEDYQSKDLYYVFVNLNEFGEKPSFHIVPSEHVSESVKLSHGNWLKSEGRNGKTHKDNPIRKFLDDSLKYQERWDLLGL